MTAKPKRPYRYWTTAEHEKFLRLYPHHTNGELAVMFGRTAESLNIYAGKHGVKKSDEFMRKKSGRFTASTAGWNRGKSHRPAGSEKTHFTKGRLPHNTRPLGAERIDKDGILWRKTAETRVKHQDWTPVKNLEFVKHHGPIPAGHFVIHANKDKADFSPGNLIAITQSENAKRNSNRDKARQTMAAKKVPAFAKYVMLRA